MSEAPLTPPGVPTPPPGPPRRTPVVTAAGGLLMTAGCLTFLAGLIVVLAGSDVLIGGEPVGDATRAIAWAAIAVGVIDVVAGVLVLRLVPAGRVIGAVLATLTVVIGLVTLSKGISSSFLQVVLGFFTLWALAAAAPAFRRADRRQDQG